MNVPKTRATPAKIKESTTLGMDIDRMMLSASDPDVARTAIVIALCGYLERSGIGSDELADLLSILAGDVAQCFEGARKRRRMAEAIGGAGQGSQH